MPNSFQKHLRYKQFDLEDFMSRIKQDCFKTPIDSKINRTLFISQYNYANDYFKNITLNQLRYNFENIYISDNSPNTLSASSSLFNSIFLVL